MKKNKFLKDLHLGQKAEDIVSNLLIECGLDVKRGKGASHDIEIMPFPPLNSCLLIEVKHDIMAARTGNVAIEYHNSRLDKPSGITSTESHFWMYVFGCLEEFYIIKVKDLKDFTSFHTPLRRIEKAGDGNASIMLYKKDFFCQHATRFDLLSIEDRIKFLCM